MDDERALVEALRAGMPGAFERAYEAHRARLYGFLFRLSRRKDVADDLFQETWVRLQRNATKLLPDTRLLAWLLTVARNLHRSYLRWRMLDMSRFFDDDEAAAAADRGGPEGTAQAKQELASLERALGRIGAGARELLLLVAIEELEPSQIQAMLGLGAEAYRQRLSRARKELREAMAPPTRQA